MINLTIRFVRSFNSMLLFFGWCRHIFNYLFKTPFGIIDHTIADSC